MKKASIRDLHIHTSELVREAAEGSVIVIEKRGEPVAELRPLSKKPKLKFPDMSHLWNDFPRIADDSTDTIGEDRDR
jgi:prevent-host-death family protein